MNHFDAIQTALQQLQEAKYPATEIWLLNPKDRKRIHVDKISIRFMEMVKRNRKKGRRKIK